MVGNVIDRVRVAAEAFPGPDLLQGSLMGMFDIFPSGIQMGRSAQKGEDGIAEHIDCLCLLGEFGVSFIELSISLFRDEQVIYGA